MRFFLLTFILFPISGFAQNFENSFPLNSEGISSYQCAHKFITESSEGYENRTYYFDIRNHPLPVRNTSAMFCHDKENYGPYDDIFIPRLNLQSDIFKVWSSHNPYFYDLDYNGSMDVHDYIYRISKIRVNIFKHLALPNTPFMNGIKNMGVVMTRFIDSSTFTYFCPKNPHYHSSNPLFRALKDIISVDTQALYMAKDLEPGVLGSDIKYLAENSLENIWFHVVDGKIETPTSQSKQIKHLFFYWPANLSDPYTRHSNQKLFKVLRGERGDIAIGCVPE